MFSIFPDLSHTCPRHVLHSTDTIKGRGCRPLCRRCHSPVDPRDNLPHIPFSFAPTKSAVHRRSPEYSFLLQSPWRRSSAVVRVSQPRATRQGARQREWLSYTARSHALFSSFLLFLLFPFLSLPLLCFPECRYTGRYFRISKWSRNSTEINTGVIYPFTKAGFVTWANPFSLSLLERSHCAKHVQ